MSDPVDQIPPRERIRLGRTPIRATPGILQMEAVECGAAALAIVLAFHGAWVPLETLRIACGISRDGSSASNIVRAAQVYGLAVKAYRREPTALHGLPMPCILHWNFNHFVVLEGVRASHAFINDPAEGRRRVTAEELDDAFTGVVLTMRPGPEFRRLGRRPQGWRLLLRELRGSRAALVLVGGVSLALVIPGIVIPALTKAFIDEVLIYGARSWLVPLLIGMGLTALLRAVVTALQLSLSLRLQTKLAVVMTSRFLWHVTRLPMSFFAQRHAGDLVSRNGVNEDVARLLSGGLASQVLSLISLAFFAAAMAFYDIVLTGIGVGLSLLNLVALRLIARRREDLSRRLAAERAKLLASTVAAVRGIETLKASGLEDDAFGQWTGIQARALNAEQSLGTSTALLDVAPALLAGLTTAAILGVGSLRVIEGALTLGGLIAFQSLMASFTGPIGDLVGQAGAIQVVRGGLDRLIDIYNYPLEPQAPPAAPPGLSQLAGRVELIGVSFGYAPLQPPLLSDLSLTVEPGTRVALVGLSGSGKSTLGRLMCGLNRPWSGQVLLDGIPLEAIPSEVVAGSVAYVDQDVVLFEGTVRDNLTLWDPTVSETDLYDALQDAAIQAEIVTRPGNYDCRVVEGGANFSGGQRQRLEIARALVGRPAILVLDEATAALDPVTERRIDDNLRRRGCTCIIIAHRLSTIRDCDEIIVLDRGRIAERGSHEDLIARAGLYADLVAHR
ncbi:NHLP family bacteriocin export ABC transporter peptidase/permease/ATPase subunit [Methylobacterium terricola]|uniref:NHLP family bacteriocin export ABC transporter peptidase/permease/ATPase subunit n=1 Tax=Methylobacterium terricola TaxID=2583531 RepID=A0A5C4L6X3_9HYPH|nr:NHLP family bacteriocin export ABC transporter peptidase/permease/ATPase subunit [Methylobacterium terricola]TNC05959.1 NHLP family bacteriocin export ABC transporter peptidase/permease/ATPase subunit [Methylobacterium terricola]